MTIIYYSNITILIQHPDFPKELTSFIPQSRLKKAYDYKSQADRARSIAASYLLQTGLDEYQGKHIKNPDISFGEDGKPYFTDYPELHFSISHSGEYVACAFSDQEIGLDIQEERASNCDKIAARFYSPSENEYLNSIKNADLRKHEFFRIWSAKEAYIKFTGLGIREGMTTFSVDLNGKRIITTLPGHPNGWICEPLTLIRNTLTMCIGENQTKVNTKLIKFENFFNPDEIQDVNQ
ncbi:MAG: 4'-phosphopantetheinyl transferase superfamily protein [Butyrivibrio sp.]|nr:4'-phosphopantetheinyl transferase superfamily protein [Butyrivibrio sp.]